MWKVFLLGAVESVLVRMGPVVPLFCVCIAVVVPAVVAALANILVASTVNDASSSIVTGCSVRQLP